MLSTSATALWKSAADEKGRALFAGQTRPRKRRPGRSGPAPRLDMEAVAGSREGFEDPHWPAWSARCLGCGACAFTCPTCHCFDMVDEGDAVGRAPRVRNWDACQYDDVHPARLGPQPRAGRRSANVSGSTTSSASPGEVRRDPLHRVRQLHAQLPGAPGRASPVMKAESAQQNTDDYEQHLSTRPDGSFEVRRQTADVKSVRMRFRDEARPGISISASASSACFRSWVAANRPSTSVPVPNWKDFIEFCFRRTGKVTDALWSIDKSDTIGFRGPYGNGYPMEKWAGKNLIFIGGGIAMPPIRCAIWYALENRDRFGDITIVYGARKVGDLVFAASWTVGRSTSGVRVVRASIPAAKRPTGKAKSVLCPPWSSGRKSRPTTPWRW